MIGLEYIAKIRLTNFSKIAEDIGISSATMNDWIRKRKKIPKSRLAQLAILLNVDEEIIKKEVNTSDKIYVIELEKYRLMKEVEDMEKIVKDIEMYAIYGGGEAVKTQYEYEIGEIINVNSHIEMMCKKKEIINGKLYQFFRQGRMVFD